MKLTLEQIKIIEEFIEIEDMQFIEVFIKMLNNENKKIEIKLLEKLSNIIITKDDKLLREIINSELELRKQETKV